VKKKSQVLLGNVFLLFGNEDVMLCDGAGGACVHGREEDGQVCSVCGPEEDGNTSAQGHA